ncbi:hypothetical protein Scep_022434 [Stephania cephalantha]|uniref:Uncharacterized protein n=1 Tax=Stephania cephalantha TaxID=152367 RepID=A0AAP0F7Y7_9MAGN
MKRLRKEFTNLRQGADERVMRYRDRDKAIRERLPRDLVKKDSDDVYHFSDGLMPDIGFYVVS